MKRWLSIALALLFVVLLFSPAEAGKWHRFGRRSGYGWSDGYHAPSRGLHSAYHQPTYWDNYFGQPPVEFGPAAPSFDSIPTPAPLPLRSGEPSPMATQPRMRGMYFGY